MSIKTNAEFDRLENYLLTNVQTLGDDRSLSNEYKTFINIFPASRIINLSPDEYCIGKGIKENSFCWWLEFGLKKIIGTYNAGSVNGHGVLYKKDGRVIKSKALSIFTDSEALSYMLKIHSEIANVDLDSNIAWIDDDAQISERAGVPEQVSIADSRKLRLLASYNPTGIIPINSPRHIGRILKSLGCPVSEIPDINKPVARALLLKKYFDQIKEKISNLTPWDFMIAIYNSELGLSPVNYDVDYINDHKDESLHFEVDNKFPPPPLNQILYGPPGTGKTYTTIVSALEVLDPEFLRENHEERKVLKQRFDDLIATGHISFVTFHQSFSYEDFVEGLRARSDDTGQLRYEIADGIFKKLCLQSELSDSVDATSQPENNRLNDRVLIIDEINRGNVSRIFGELITLIEESKRDGEDEALSVLLPYSKKRLSVPKNLYLIGTMNTADRSLAGLDIALRRRFAFREMPPRPDLLSEISIGGLDIGELLSVMNKRIELLLDRDHCLGHAYFMPLKDERTLEKLASIFQDNVLPLLREYFFEDWQRIQWVLNDHRKPPATQFVSKKKLNTKGLFGDGVNISEQDWIWKPNPAAFGQIESYLGIISAQQGDEAE